MSRGREDSAIGLSKLIEDPEQESNIASILDNRIAALEERLNACDSFFRLTSQNSKIQENQRKQLVKSIANDLSKLEQEQTHVQSQLSSLQRLIKDAISANYNSEPGSLDKKMAEYAWAVLEGRPHFHICIVMDVSPFCDCHPENDAPIVSDVGMFASFDPVALDQACADAVNKMPALVAGSILGERDRCHHDHFKDVSPTTNWEIQLEHSEKLGIGTRQYELITVK